MSTLQANDGVKLTIPSKLKVYVFGVPLLLGKCTWQLSDQHFDFVMDDNYIKLLINLTS